MYEERFTKAEAVPMTLLIIERLGEREKKISRMAEIERKISSRNNRRKTLPFLLLAASVLVALFSVPIYRSQMSPLDRLGISTPTMTEYRVANMETTEISTLIEKKSYGLALRKTKEALEKSDLAIKELHGISFDWDMEELVYEENLEKSANAELRWTYIYLLVRQRHNKEAKKQLKIYLKDKRFCDHQAEAVALLKEIN